MITSIKHRLATLARLSGRLLGTCCLLAGLAGCDGTATTASVPPAAPVKFHAASLRDPEFGKDFHLKDARGQPRTLADWRGKVILLFFGYTQCPDVCPTALSRAAAVMAQLGAEADKVQVLFVTLDPERDTPAVLGQYPAAFHPAFMGLSATPEATPQLARDFRIFYRRNPGKTPETYTIDHTASTYAYDPQGRLRLVIAHDAQADEVADDIRQLLAGK